MCEDLQRVWCVGGFGLDEVIKLDRIERPALEESLGISPGETNLMVTLRPETLTGTALLEQMIELLSALEEASAQLIFTTPNAKNEGRLFFNLVGDFVARHPGGSCAYTSLGQQRYLSVLAEVDAVVGNSPSGLLEAPALGNGTRRLSVVDCAADRRARAHTNAQVLVPDFGAAIQGQENPHGYGGASERTVSVIEDWLVGSAAAGKKHFYDLSEAEVHL